MIRIYDSLFTDTRFLSISRAIGQVSALGNYVLISSLSKDYWSRGMKLIPENIWELNKFPNEFLEFGLVLKKPEGYYLDGTKENFNFVPQGIFVNKKPLRAIRLSFLDKELQDFISNVSDLTRKNWIEKYDETTLIDRIRDAFEWCNSNKRFPKNIGSLVNKFLSDSKSKNKFSPELEKQLDEILNDKG